MIHNDDERTLTMNEEAVALVRAKGQITFMTRPHFFIIAHPNVQLS
jgi:hypothetical protein